MTGAVGRWMNPHSGKTLFKWMRFIGHHPTSLTTPLTHNIQNNSRWFAQCKSNTPGLQFHSVVSFRGAISVGQKARHVLCIAESCAAFCDQTLRGCETVAGHQPVWQISLVLVSHCGGSTPASIGHDSESLQVLKQGKDSERMLQVTHFPIQSVFTKVKNTQLQLEV